MFNVGVKISFPDLQPTLVAGDSNVHRLKAAAESVGDDRTQFLPLSGARFTNDKKAFHRSLLEQLQMATYRRVYIVLGSNDVLSEHNRFYREAADLCDRVHGVSRNAEVVLCSIIPRAADLRRCCRTKGKLHRMLAWIREANSLLCDLSYNTPYVRFLSIEGFLADQYLCRDGLHLNQIGARHFHSQIYADSMVTDVAVFDNQDLCDDDWPALGSDEIASTAYRPKMLYSDAVKIGDVITSDTTHECTRMQEPTRKPAKKQTVVVQMGGRRQTSRRLAWKRWVKRKCMDLKRLEQESTSKNSECMIAHVYALHRNYTLNYRNEENSHIYVELSDQNAVWLKACRIFGSSLKQSKDNLVSTSWTKHSKEVSTKEKPKKQTRWFSCPDCDVSCSREDFLLDHLSRKHSVGHVSQTVEDDTHELDKKMPCKKETLHEEEAPMFTNWGWRKLFQLMTVGLLCGRRGLTFVMKRLLIQNHGNTNQLKLMLSNDVEKNPGPMYTCRWENCSCVFCTMNQLKVHACEHILNDKHCKWSDCHGIPESSMRSLVDHLLTHLNNQPAKTFQNIEEWYQCLPVGRLTDDTNLHLCPPHLRSKLQLILFDDEFKMKTDPYTVADHMAYVDNLSILEPTKFNERKRKYLEKYADDGKTDNKFKLNDEKQPSQIEFKFVDTCRPELASSMFTGTILKSVPRKRKHSDMETLSEKDIEWPEILMKNLSICDEAIKIQKFVLEYLFNQSFLQSNKQSFLKIEQESAKLAAMNACTLGTFICCVFKCIIHQKNIYYIRYFESGVYSGLMQQKYVQLLKEHYNASDDDIMLHNVITAEDINDKRKEYKAEKIVKKDQHSNEKGKKRPRPDKSLSYSLSKVFPAHVTELNNFGECKEVKLDSFVVHILPFKSKVTVDTSEKIYLHVKNTPVPCIETLLLDYRMNRHEPSSVTSSKDILSQQSYPICSLMEQSVKLNCLSGDIGKKPEIFARKARFESNLLNFTFINDATSLRNRTLQLYLKNDVNQLVKFYLKYFPDLRESKEGTIDFACDVRPEQSVVRTNMPKKVKRVSNSVKKYDNLPAQSKNMNENLMSLFEKYCLSLVERGKMVIQSYEDSSNFICCMNDYNEVDGSFRESDFVYTTMQRQELGDHFECTCKTYHTSISLKDSQNIDPDLNLALVPSGENFVTCIHCRFLKQTVAPSLECSDRSESKIQKFIQESLSFAGKSIVKLFSKRETKKFSILPDDEDKPSIVHLTKNKNLGYIVTCFNGRCLSLKGHKKMLTTLASANVCKHLKILKEHTEYWQDLVQEQITPEINVNNNEINREDSMSIDSEGNFDENSCLWSFKCKSQHSPNQRNDPTLRYNVIKRDSWNDLVLERYSDGYLKGPVLVVEIPNHTCNCGSGWLKCPGDENYNENGLSVHDKNRHLTIYTSTAPVKCEVHTRLCYNAVSPCTLPWDEGKKDSIHVLSRDTAAGDEIGWEFVNMVINSGCSFSSFCHLKTSTYQLRAENAKFMDPSVFLKWWFSWAANMKIDFRKPCDICGFEPKRLCCDGTKVGVGFRHAKFEEINSFDQNTMPLNTLHRRMDRCFLKNMNGIEKYQMIRNRETLNYLAKRVLEKLPDPDQIETEELNERINEVKAVLPDEVKLSFERFFEMDPSEKIAYAHVLKMLSTTASVSSLLPPGYCANLQQLVQNPDMSDERFNEVINGMRSYAPELRDLICQSMLSNNFIIPNDIRLLIQYLINESLDMATTEPEVAVPQPGTYNPAKFGRAYYFNESGLKLRNVRQFTIDQDAKVKRNVDHDDSALEFERCQKLYSKVHVSAHATSNLFLWFCADHGHCYGFHMTGAEGRKDPSASLYSHLEKPPQDIFYDFACNLQEYCLNRESGFYKNVRFFHDTFHSYAHKCSCTFKSKRLQGFETVNSEICEQFNSFIQCIKETARQMSQEHFCFYLQFFLHEWNQRKQDILRKKIKVAVAGISE